MTNRILHLDGETYCNLSLPDVGASVYVGDPSFVVTVLAWAFDDDPPHAVVWPHTGPYLPAVIVAHIIAGGEIHCHNASFEHAILNLYYGANVPPESMICSMQRALAFGLPAGLGEAGGALGLPIQKDKTARALMLQMAKPRKPSKGTTPVPWHECDPVKLGLLKDYCIKDVLAERALGKAIPYLTPREQRISLLDARSNLLGVLIDLDAVDTLKGAAKVATDDLIAECMTLTNREVLSPGTETAKLTAWLARQGLQMGDLSKETVADVLANCAELPPNVRRVLEIRQLAAKSSLKKLERMQACRSPIDGRARGLLQYRGAGRTGRWAGRLIQIQNLPIPEKNLDVDRVLACIQANQGYLPEILFPQPLKTISSCLRGCIVAKAGHRLLSLDLSQIEARVLAWLAGQQDVVDTFRRNEDIYTHDAAAQGSSNRQFGKVLRLGLGFGMGPGKFMETALIYGVTLTPAQAERAVDTWRAQNRRIVNFWWNLTCSTLEAIGPLPQDKRSYALTHPFSYTHETDGSISVGRIRIKKVGDCLVIKKPSGDKLFYHSPRVGQGMYGSEFEFSGVLQGSGGWSTLRTYGGKFCENIVQSVARDILAEAAVRIEDRFGLVPVMSVHDELVFEMGMNNALWVNVKAEFEKAPAWALDLPIASEVKLTSRYGK